MTENVNSNTKAKRADNYYKQSEMRDNIVTPVQNKFQPPDYVVDRHFEDSSLGSMANHLATFQDEQSKTTIENSGDNARNNRQKTVPSRAQQMELTMKWWNDASTDWREKWGKAKAERDRAREQVKALRNKLEAARRDYSRLKAEHDRCLTQMTSSQDKALSQIIASPDGLPTEGINTIDQKVQENQQLKSELENAMRTIKDLQAKLATSNTNRNEPSNNDTETLKKKIAELEQECDECKRELKEYKMNRKDQIDKYVKDLEDAQLTALAIETKLKETTAELNKLKVDSHSDSIIIKRLETEKMSLLQENKSLLEKIETFQLQLNGNVNQSVGLSANPDRKVLKPSVNRSNEPIVKQQIHHDEWIPSRVNDLNFQLGLSDEKWRKEESTRRHQPNELTKKSFDSKLYRGKHDNHSNAQQDYKSNRMKLQGERKRSDDVRIAGSNIMSHGKDINSSKNLESSLQEMNFEDDYNEDIDMITV